MSTDHRKPAGGPNDGAGEFDWFKVLDYAVWGAVGLLVILAVEWLAGKVTRESLARGASRHLAKVTTEAAPTEG